MKTDMKMQLVATQIFLGRGSVAALQAKLANPCSQTNILYNQQ